VGMLFFVMPGVLMGFCFNFVGSFILNIKWLMRQGFTDCLIQEMKSNWTDIAFFFLLLYFFWVGNGFTDIYSLL
jgi:hypothetical protein